MAEGVVAEAVPEKLTKETKKGVEVTRNGTEGNPALFITREGGNSVVRKQSEVFKVHGDQGQAGSEE